MVRYGSTHLTAEAGYTADAKKDDSLFVSRPR